MKKLRIQANHPLRKKVDSVTTTNNYYDSKGQAINTIDAILNEYGMELGLDTQCDGDDSYTDFNIYTRAGAGIVCSKCDDRDELQEFENRIHFRWYRMGSGRWEITTYVT